MTQKAQKNIGPFLFVGLEGGLFRDRNKQLLAPGVVRMLYRLQEDLRFEIKILQSEPGVEGDQYPVNVLSSEGVSFEVVELTQLPEFKMHPKISDSFFVGDDTTEISAVTEQGISAISLLSGGEESREHKNWEEFYRYLLNRDRIVEVTRTTKETDIAISLNLDGEGKGTFSTGLGFFDHMLEQIARHGGIDMTVLCKGDLHIDEHHTVEDVGILLGEALNKALDDKRGIDRYGFSLPMDEVEAQVLIDLSGRPHCRWEVEFTRDSVGDVPTEMFPHFFQSLAFAASMTLHVRANGENDHHIIEGVFKAFAKALKQAVHRPQDAVGVPSTKGTL